MNSNLNIDLDNSNFMNFNYFNLNDSNKNSNKKLSSEIIHNLSDNNIIFKHMMYLITEQDYKFKQIEKKSSLDDYIKNLDNTPVYITYNCGVLYIPNKSKVFSLINHDLLDSLL